MYAPTCRRAWTARRSSDLTGLQVLRYVRSSPSLLLLREFDGPIRCPGPRPPPSRAAAAPLTSPPPGRPGLAAESPNQFSGCQCPEPDPRRPVKSRSRVFRATRRSAGGGGRYGSVRIWREGVWGHGKGAKWLEMGRRG
eukprot:416187-Hanusia_phi.AAC.1